MKMEIHAASFGFAQDRRLFENLSASLEDGNILAVLGPNGAGKTTLLRCILGFRSLNEGTITFDGKTAQELGAKKFRQLTAYVPQAHRQIFGYTCMEMVLLGRGAYLSFFEQPSGHDYALAREAMERVGIGHLRDRLCTTLSGGEMQLVLIARALASRPKLLVLDEPETGLDFRNQIAILKMLSALAKKDHIGILLNTHDPNHAYAIADQVILFTADHKTVVGDKETVLTAANIQKAFGVEITLVHHAHGVTIVPASTGLWEEAADVVE